MAMTHRDELQDEEIIINECDGLPNVRPDEVRLELAREDLSPDPLDPLDELPKSLIVTNVRPDVFEDPLLRARMEELFGRFSDAVTFVWLRSFRRLRVNYADAGAAASARVHLHRFPFPPVGEDGEAGRIGCYFAQPVTPAGARSLLPPKPEKQFLISPPSSPPVGWEPRPENEPLVNRELLEALAQLSPGDTRELVPPKGSQPAIVVHAAAAAAPPPADAVI